MTIPFTRLVSRGFFEFFYLLFPIATPSRGRNRRFQRKNEPAHNINERIRADKLRVVTADGEMLGVFPTTEALSKAKEAGLDLVEISPKAVPPVAKIIDYGKFLYDQKKKEKHAKKMTKATEMKGIRLSFRIGEGDMERQRKHAEEFLLNGHPVRIQMVLRGREKAHKDLAFEKLGGFIKSLEEFCQVDQTPRFGGSQIIAMLKPTKSTK